MVSEGGDVSLSRQIAGEIRKVLPGANGCECMLEHMNSVPLQLEPDRCSGLHYGTKK
jgi:hypothetical protein